MCTIRSASTSIIRGVESLRPFGGLQLPCHLVERPHWTTVDPKSSALSWGDVWHLRMIVVDIWFIIHYII